MTSRAAMMVDVSLYWRIFLFNGGVLVAAVIVLVVSPATVSAPIAATEAVILALGIAAMLVANATILRLTLRPLERLTRTMRTIDLLHPGRRPDVAGPTEISALIRAFNTMLDRLEAERAGSSGRALSAQEAERQRVARELHDEVGQSLTAVLLELKQVAARVPAPVREEVESLQETTRATLDEVGRIARRLRPGVLDELGLVPALRALTAEFRTSELAIDVTFDGQLPPLDRDLELVIYRVTQEGLTNVIRHANATHASIELHSGERGIELRLGDDGRGIAGAVEGAGIRGMRERALYVGGDLAHRPRPEGGTELVLRVPATRRLAPYDRADRADRADREAGAHV